MVYQHDNRPWLIGFSGGKDSTLLCYLVFEMISRLPKDKINKTVYIVSSDTMVENPIVRNYMHRMSNMIGKKGEEFNIKSDIIYPAVQDSFWCKLIGLGYATPQAPGFRWCTERLKIKPMNQYTYEKIKKNGEIILLLGVRKDESINRANNISSREIEDKLLIPHKDIKNAYVYNPITNVLNEIVWDFLLKDDGLTPWGSDNKYLFSLYQGEHLGEEQSVVGEIDKEKIPVTGNSRFGCWVCTMVKEDKSLKTFIDKGEEWLIPLRDYRDWLIKLRSTPGAREYKRRNGSIYRKADNSLGEGAFTMETRRKMLKKLLEIEVKTGLSLITIDELKEIDSIWDREGDLSRRYLVDLYYNIKGSRLPWDQYKIPIFTQDIIEQINKICQENNVEFELISKLIIEIELNKNYANNSTLIKSFDKIMQQGWLHYEEIEKVLRDEN